MVGKTSDIYATKGYIPLKTKTYNSYENLNGTNLLRKAAQLVRDIEGLNKAPSFQNYLKQNSLDLNQLYTYSPEDFSNFINEIKTKLKESNKPLTVINVLEAQRSLSKDNDKKLDVKS